MYPVGLCLHILPGASLHGSGGLLAGPICAMHGGVRFLFPFFDFLFHFCLLPRPTVNASYRHFACGLAFSGEIDKKIWRFHMGRAAAVLYVPFLLSGTYKIQRGDL